jgi:hypothetical protein
MNEYEFFRATHQSYWAQTASLLNAAGGRRLRA